MFVWSEKWLYNAYNIIFFSLSNKQGSFSPSLHAWLFSFLFSHRDLCCLVPRVSAFCSAVLLGFVERSWVLNPLNRVIIKVRIKSPFTARLVSHAHPLFLVRCTEGTIKKLCEWERACWYLHCWRAGRWNLKFKHKGIAAGTKTGRGSFILVTILG